LEINKKESSCQQEKETVPCTLVVESLIIYLLPLANSFFDLSFSLLPNLISFNTP